LFFGVLALAGYAMVSATPDASVGHVTVTALGDGVYSAIRNEPLGLAGNANSLFIVNDSDVIVVDAQFTRAATLENLAALRRITSKPVTLVINTHWHDDHLAGNQVYQDSFPGAHFIAQTNTRADLIALGRPNRTGQVKFAPLAADRFEKLLGMGLGVDSLAASPAERASEVNAIRIIREYVAESSGFREVLPDSVVERQLTLVRGKRAIELHWFGRGNTRGDLVTWLPAERIVATGDLLVAPVQYGFNSYPTEWIAVLDSIAALSPRAVVPGHGPVMRDLGYLKLVRKLLVSAREQTLAAYARGVSAEEIGGAVTVDSLRIEVTKGEKWMNWMFRQFFVGPVVARVYEEAKNAGLK
jgi:glyoxylase-like metal-dependent hydrolase (beta-lactamase superfamily II)